MSFLSGNKNKSHFYVEFLGWMECRGVRGDRYTDPIIRELKRRQQKMDTPPRLTIQVSKKDVKVTQDVEDKKKKSIKKIRFPAIPARDVTYVRQGMRSDGRPDDIVACIYLGYMPRTQRFVHVHVYRFDEATTAATFARQISTLVESNIEHIRGVEVDLANKGEIEDPRLNSSDGMATDSAVGSASSNYSDDDGPKTGSDDIDPDLQSLHDFNPFDNVADEFKFRLNIGDKPILLPPKDYDTVHRVKGNLDDINKRRCLNMNIVGDWAKAAAQRERNGSSESGVDLNSPSSEAPESGSELSPISTQSQHHAHSIHASMSPPGSVATNSPAGHRRGNSLGQGSLHSSHNGSHHSGGSRSNSPDITATVDRNNVYPPKIKSPPMSPNVGGQAARLRGSLLRQSSEGSFHGSAHSSEGAAHPAHAAHQHSAHPPPQQNGVKYYKGGSNNDIYALPNKGRFVNGHKSPRDIPQPDYYAEEGDEEVQIRGGAGPRYRQPDLTRSMPAAMIRSEMNLPHSARGPSMHSEEMRYFRRVEETAQSQNFVGGRPMTYR